MFPTLRRNAVSYRLLHFKTVAREGRGDAHGRATTTSSRTKPILNHCAHIKRQSILGTAPYLAIMRIKCIPVDLTQLGLGAKARLVCSVTVSIILRQLKGHRKQVNATICRIYDRFETRSTGQFDVPLKPPWSCRRKRV